MEIVLTKIFHDNFTNPFSYRCWNSNRYFKFEALKGYVLLPGWLFLFELYEGVTLLTVTSEMNTCGTEIRSLVYPSGLYWLWNTFFKLLSKEFSLDHKKDVEIIAFMELAGPGSLNCYDESQYSPN